MVTTAPVSTHVPNDETFAQPFLHHTVFNFFQRRILPSEQEEKVSPFRGETSQF